MIIMYTDDYTYHHHHVKCGSFRALVTAYLKQISNESFREASNTLVMMSHLVS